MKYIMTDTAMIEKILGGIYRSEENLHRQAAEAAAAEVGYAFGASGAGVKLFSDCTGNYAEVTLPGGYDSACSMKLCCIVDTDTMEVRGICPVGSI